MATDPTIVVAGAGMVGHRFVEAAVSRRLHESYRIVVIGEEPRPAYDRVHLSSLFDGAEEQDLRLAPEGWYEEHGVEHWLGERVTGIDRAAACIQTDCGREVGYARLVLATGSSPFVPPVVGADAAGAFVYRTISDLDAIRAWATAGATRGVVVGGGLLGLEAANALRNLGLHTTVVEFGTWLMAVQLDAGGGRALRRHVEGLGIDVRPGHSAAAVLTTADGRVAGLAFVDEDQTPVDTDMVVFAAGIRPRDELARDAGLDIGERGGVVIDDACVTSDLRIFAVGECASHRGRCHGLVAPGYEMAEIAAAHIAHDSSAVFAPAQPATKLKLLGVDVAVAGVADDADAVVIDDPSSATYRKLVLDDAGAIVGAVLVGDITPFPALVSLVRSHAAIPTDAIAVLTGAAAAGDDATVCQCYNVAGAAVRAAVVDNELCDVGGIKACTNAGTGCGSCVPLLNELLLEELRKAGQDVQPRLCAHFTQTRQELFDIVRTTGIRRFAKLVDRFGTGRGCEICKPAVASMFASLSSGHILDGEQSTLQDTNDRFLANLQRDGTYSVVPRVPGGEIAPDKLIALGEIAADFDLYTKITGGQRIDLFGARVDQLPDIWDRLVNAGFESGHAYGKALRTVKSCVGSTWCRYGVQDSVQLAIDLELRYRGLRAPHKVKCAVSGCARECAEAQGKDIGVIATERGWNLFVGGNGGMRPQHAQLLAEDLDTETLVRYIDRFFILYIRTADRLERTATWLNKLEGGIDYVRRVVIDDALGIAADLEADMARHVATYECEWKAVLDDPIRLARFKPFVNSDEPDEDRAYVRVRGQRQPV
ncbi:MAG TPA: nitrite reductase large subunit NirB [Acidimicrobiales bacterium]|nr:nitrite reductase large subunit NirB [Acidimicrobiales bacterium]